MTGIDFQRSISLIERLHQKLGERYATRIFDTLRRSDPEAMQPRVTFGVVLSYVVSGIVHLITIALLGLGLYLIAEFWEHWLIAVVGVFLIIAAWSLTPSLGKKPDHVLARDQAPSLYKLTDKIAGEIGTPAIGLIAVTPEINANYSRFGWRRTSVLTIGIPLWLTLNEEQKVALIAHEMSHQKNRDVARGFWVYHALMALAHWYFFLTPSYDPDAGIGKIIAHYVLHLLALPVYLTGYILIRLICAESQRAEYLADHIGSRVSGTEQFISLNNRLSEILTRDTALFDATLATPARNPEYRKIFTRFVEAVADVSASEVEEFERKSGQDHLSIDATHPPTKFRNQMLAAFPCQARLKLARDEAKKIDTEVSVYNDELGLELARFWAVYFK